MTFFIIKSRREKELEEQLRVTEARLHEMRAILAQVRRGPPRGFKEAVQMIQVLEKDLTDARELIDQLSSGRPPERLPRTPGSSG